MPSFDDDYMRRREKQIEDLYMLRAMTWASVVTGLLLALIALGLLSAGYGTLGSVLFVVALLFEAGSIFMFASYFAEKAADRAIQKEYELLALYGAAAEKPKRGGQIDTIQPADDGELDIEDELAEHILRREERSR